MSDIENLKAYGTISSFSFFFFFAFVRLTCLSAQLDPFADTGEGGPVEGGFVRTYHEGRVLLSLFFDSFFFFFLSFASSRQSEGKKGMGLCGAIPNDVNLFFNDSFGWASF